MVNWAYPEDNPNWDPVVVGATGATEVLSLIYEPLFTLNPAGQIQPALATGYKYNAAGTKVTITLRPGLTFQDGSPLNAAAVAYDINRAQTQSNSALKTDYAEIGSTTVLSKTQVRLNLKQKDYQIPYILANRDGLISSEKAAKSSLSKLNDSAPVGAGPFEVTKLVPDASVTLKRFPGYWDAKDIHVSQVNLSLNVDPSTVLSGLQTGVYNFVTGLPAQDVALAKKDGLNVVTNEKAGWVVTFISLNFNKPPFNNPLVAKAVQDAINREQFVKELSFGLGTPTVQPFPSTSPAYNPSLESEYQYDPSEAKKLLKQAGYKPNQLKLTLDVFTALESSGAELLQQQLAAVGIKLTIDAQNIDQFYTGYYGKTDSITLYGYVGRDSKLVALDEHYGDDGILNLSSPRVASQYAAARQKVLGVPLAASDYDSVLQAATKAGVETGSTISLYSSPQPYASKGLSTLPLIDDVIRWNGVTVSGS